MLAVHQDTDGTGSMTWGAFASTANSVIRYYDHNINPDPANPPDAKARVVNVNRLQLYFPDTDPPMAPLLSYPANNAQVFNGEKLSWSLASESADALGYDLYLNGILVSENQSSQEYQLSGIAPGNYSWYVIAKNDLGSSPASISRAFTVGNGVVIGDGRVNASTPIYPSFKSNYAQSIYLKDEINTSNQRIEKIAYYYNGGSELVNSTNWVVYLAHTNKSQFDGVADWIPASSMIQVFEGHVDVPAEEAWVELTLDTPFLYNNVDNLVISVYKHSEDIDTGNAVFYSTDMPGEYRTLMSYTSTSKISPFAPPNGNRLSSLPNMRMKFEDIPSEPELALGFNSFDFGQHFANSHSDYQSLMLINNAGGTVQLSSADISIVGDDYAMFACDLSGLPFAIASGQSAFLPIRYEPSIEGAHSAILRINYSGMDYDVQLHGSALGEYALFESFESPSFPPRGWTVFNGGSSEGWKRSISKPHSGSAHAVIEYDSSAHDDWLISPKIAPTASNHTFRFWGSNDSNYYDERFNVKVSTTDGSLASFVHYVALDQSTGGATYMLHEYDLSSFVGQNIFVAIQAISEDEYSLLIDDISGPDRVVEIPAAPLLSTLYDESILVSWTPTLVWNAAPGGITLSYKLFLDTENPPTIELTQSSSNSYTFSQPLAAGTKYYWSVQGENNDGVGPMSSVYSFTTMPNDVAIIGTDASFNQFYQFPTVYGGYYLNSREQYIITADELIAAGAQSGLLDGIAFNVHSPNESANLPNFALRVGYSADSEFLSTTFRNDLEEVHLSSSYTPAVGWNGHSFDTPIYWDGSTNLIIETSFDLLDDDLESASVYQSSTAPAHRTLYQGSDFIAWNAFTTGGTSDKRPNMALSFQALPTGIPAAPILLNPADGVTALSQDGFELSWKADLLGGGMPDYYAVFIASDEDNIFDEHFFETTNTSFNPVTDGEMDFAYGSRWYWTVQAINADGESMVNAPRSFSIIVPPAQIAVSPSFMSSVLEMGTTEIQELSITNTGGLPLNYNIRFAEDQSSRPRISAYDPQTILAIDPQAAAMVEYCSYIGPVTYKESRAIFDLQFHYAAKSGEYSVATDGEYLYTSYWNSNGKFGKYTLDGEFIESFIINGVARSFDLTYDGTFFYATTDSDVINILDLANRSLEGSISSPYADTRGIAYDEDSDGFWITSGWSANSQLIDRSGQNIRSLTLGNSANSGIAFDNHSGANPTLWGFVQDGVNNNLLVQYNLDSGDVLQSYDISNALPSLVASVYPAGGMSISTSLVHGTATLLTMSQSHSISGWELCPVVQWVSSTPVAGVVEAGESQLVQVKFDPSNVGPGSYTGEFTIHHNDPNQSPVQLPLSLDVSGNWPAQFSIYPEGWAFDSCELLNPYTKTFTIKNLGGSIPSALSIDAGGISLLNDSQGSFLIDAPGLPVSLNHHETYRFNVIFTPQSLGNQSATLRIVDNTGTHSFALNGNAIPEEMETNILLSAMVTGDENVKLSWMPYEVDGSLHWDDGVNYNAIGLTNGGTFSVASRFPQALLTPYNGQYLHAIRFYAQNTNQSQYTLKVWTGDDDSHTPMYEVYSDAVLADDGWNQVELGYIPIPSTGSLFIGYEVTHGAGAHPAAVDAGPAIAYYGDLISTAGSWDSALNASLNHNWNIQGLLSETSRGAVKLTQIPVKQQELSSKDLIEGFETSTALMLDPDAGSSRALVGYNVYRDGELINAAPINLTSYVDETLPPGTYSYHVEAQYHSGSIYSNSISATIVAQDMLTVPFEEDWSSNSFGTNAWMKTADNFTVNSSIGNSAPAALFNWNPRMQDYTEFLTTPWIDGSGVENLNLSFSLILNNDSTDAINQMSVDVYNSNAWIPVHNSTSLDGSFPWTSFSYDISEHALGRYFKIRFKAHGEDSYMINYWGIDNIRISELHEDDIAPSISHLPLLNSPRNDMGFQIKATIVDDAIWNNPISGAELYYDAGAGEIMIPMQAGANDLYTAFIPAQEYDTFIQYYIRAWDSENNESSTDVYGFMVDNPVWISYDQGPTNYMGLPNTYHAGNIYDNPYYGTGIPLKILGVDVDSYSAFDAGIVVYEFNGSTLNPAAQGVTVSLPGDYVAYDVSSLDITINSPMFIVSFQGIPGNSYVGFDSSHDYKKSLVNSGTGWSYLANEGAWCIGAYITNEITELEAPQISISITDGSIVLDWEQIPHAEGYRIYSSNDTYAIAAWAEQDFVATPGYIYNGSEDIKFFKVSATTESPLRAKMKSLIPDRIQTQRQFKTTNIIELEQSLKNNPILREIKR